MIVQVGSWYTTQRGRIVGPVQRMQHMLTETYWINDFIEPGIWDKFGRCGDAQTKTGQFYGNLVAEVSEP